MHMINFGFSSGDQGKNYFMKYKQKMPFRHFMKYKQKMPFRLAQLAKKLSSSIPFSVQIIWREPKDHCQYFYFYLTKAKSFFFKQT